MPNSTTSSSPPLVAPAAAPPGATIPAKYANFFTVFVSPAIVRISFAEAFGSPESALFHTAVSLLPADAKTLAEAILSTLATQEAAQRAAQQPAAQEHKDGA